MAFEDSLIGNGDDFDPHTATESLIRQTAPGPLPAGALDPRMLNTRLARKLAQPSPVEPLNVDLTQDVKTAAAPDFSAQAIEPAATVSTEADFSGQATEPPMIGPEAPPATNNISSYPIEFGKGVAEGAKNMGAAALKGTAAVGIPTVAAPELLDELQNLKGKTPAQLAKMQGRVLREVSDRGLQMDYISALRRISQGGDAAKEVEALRPKFEANNKRATEPVKDKPLFKAGQAVEDFGKEALAPRPGFEPGKSWTRDIGSGAGSMAAGIALSMVPGIGPAAAGTLFTTAGMGEAADKAVQNNATPDQVRLAAKLGGVAGATDLVDALIPMLGGTGRALGFLKRMGVAAVKGALMEGGQEGLQQLAQNAIAKGIYKPDQDLFEDVPRSMAIAAILGGAGGGISGAASRGRDTTPGLAPPPGGGAAPGTGPGPDPTGPSSPEDIADFVRQAREGAPPPPQPDAPMSDAERMRAYTASRDSHGGASETEILKAAGLDPATMDEQARIDAVIRAAKVDASREQATGSASSKPAADETESSHLRYATLREAGYSDEDIDNMSASQRKAEFNDAVASGIKPGAAMGKHKKRAPKAAEPDETTLKPNEEGPKPASSTGLPEAFGSMGKDMGEGLRSMLWSRVEAGETSEGRGMNTSALMQGAKMIRERGGLQTREEFDAYANEQGTLTSDTPEFQQGMRALVEKYAKNDTGQNVPESRATLKAQQNQLIAGERSAQMFPKGTKEMPLPPGMQRVKTERGTFHFDPKKTTAEKITEASAAGRENELLGLGSFSKADIDQRQGENSIVVVERTPDGTEVRAAVGTPSTAEQQRAELEKGKSAGNTVSVETPEQTLEGRKPKGTRDEPIEIKTAADVEAISKAANVDYTPAQGEANNRKLGHGKFHGLPISIEVAPGGVRKMVNPETGEAVEVQHSKLAAYGYILDTVGADGMHVDLYLGNAPDSPTVYVFDEIDRDTGKFRQHKVMGGFRTEQNAFSAYIGTSSKSAETLGASTPMSIDDFKAWLENGDTTQALKPASGGPVKAPEAGNALTEASAGQGDVPKETPPSPGAEASGSGTIMPERQVRSNNKDSSRSVAQRTDEPLSLLQFIASRGGLRPDPELTALDIRDHRVQIPGRKGFFGLIKSTGDSLDMMREAAEEAGYLRGENNKTSTIRDLLDAIDTELRGNAKLAEGDEGKTTKRQRTSLAESSAAARDAAIIANVEAIKAEYTELPEGLAESAATIMADELLDIDSAVEMAAVRAVNEDEDYQITENEIVATYGEGVSDAIQSRPASEDGGPATSAGDQERRSEEGEEAVGDGEPDAGARAEGSESQTVAETRRHHYAMERATDERWQELSDPDIKDVHPGDIFSAVRFNLDYGNLSVKNARSLMDALGEEEVPHEESIDVLARTKIDKLQGGWGIRFPYKDEQAQGRMWATIVGIEEGYIKIRNGGTVPTDKLRDLIANPPPPLPPLPDDDGGLPAVRDDLFVEIGGKRLPMTSFEDASRAYREAIEQTGATVSGRTGPQAPQPIITNSKGETVAHISYNGKVWAGEPGNDARALLYEPSYTERTEAGEQTVLPGAERIGQGEQAQRRADQPLKPKVAQKPADAGLFGDEMDQRDLLDVKPADERAAFRDSLTAHDEATAPNGMRFKVKESATGTWFYQYAEPDSSMWMQRGPGYPAKWGKSRAIGEAEMVAFPPEIERIEAALGSDADLVAPVDIARAAEIMADNPGMEPETAFGQAVAINAVEQGFITEQEAEEAYGPEVISALEAEAEGSRQRGGDPEPESDVAGEIGGDSAAQAGELPSGGQAGEQAAGDGAAAAAPDAAEQPAASGGTAQDQPAAETADDTRRRLERDAPTWAEILHELPMVQHGKYTNRDTDLAARLMFEITGKRQPSYDDLTPAQKHELMDRLAGPQKEPIIEAGESDGVQAPVPTGDAPASAEDVQPAQPGGDADGVRGPEGGGSEQAVPRPDGERAEDAGRVSEGARGARGDRASDGGDARLSEPRADDAPDGRAKRPAKRAADTVGENFVIEPGALDEGRGQKAKARDNIKALEIVQKLDLLGRPANAFDQADLAKYVGWGGIKNIFPDESGAYGEGFRELGSKLRGMLSDEEYTTARRSIQYAHYTAEDVVRAMWGAVTKMGFTGGQVFEPGMGVGNFAGMMPQDIAANTHYQGVELDHVTARIAKYLYPNYGVRQDDFTKTRLPENSYDLVIGNPPFADVAIKSDPKYKQGFLLHDYFFAKSLDAVRPGGLLAFVTSAGTMNKLDTGAREYLADRADLVGAIRLPGDAFMKNAGTMVTTDIIFLRKRLPGDVAGDRSWTETAPVALPGKDGDIEVNVNSYFLANPRMVLGRQDANDRLYPGRYSVKAIPGSDFKADLAAAIDNLPADVMSPWQDTNAESHQHDFDTTEKKEGTYYLGPDGSLHQVTNGVGQKVGQRGKGVENGRTAADMERIKGLIPVRDALRAVYAADLKGDTANAERARALLNKTYDAFVKAFGPINKAVIQTRRPNVIQMESARAEAREEARYADAIFREGDFDATPFLDGEKKLSLSAIARMRQEARDEAAKKGLTFDEGDFDLDEVPDVVIDKRPNVDPFMDDPESYRLRAIESYDEGTGIGHKSDVFRKNIITREVTPKINSVNDGLLYSLSQYGRVNIPAIAEMVKKSEAEVIAELGEQVFKVPGTKDTFQTRDEYLSGNVRQKLELAQRAADRNPEFRRNVAALEANQPNPLAPSQIHASLGMPWIPPATVEQFAREELGLDTIRVRYTSQLASWTVSGDTDSVASRSTWGTEDKRAPSILQSALNRQTIKIYDESRDADNRKISVLNVAKTEAVNDKLMQMREKFSGWIWTDQDRSDTLAAYYNENYNNLVVREYNGDYLTTPGIASDWSWRPHQKRVIARIIQSGNTYVAHAVGAGKTSEYIGAIMEMRRLGLVRKPMVAVPNHMLAQFTKEWYHQYPTARLAIADDKRFHNDRRKQFIANVAMEDLDAIIITHSSFGMIPVSDEFQNSIVNREIAQYREVLAKLKSEGGDSRITRSRIEKQIERLEQRLVSRKGRKDATFTFEEMGVDHLTIDEAHLFRKLDFSTAMSNLKGVSPEGSQMAWDLYVKSLYLDTIRPGRGLVLGSGTPITNTMAELYTLSRYLQPQVLAERGLEKFDAWAGAFGESVSELEQNAAGEYKPVSRFAKFVNVAELSAMVRQVMDVVTGKQLEQYVPRPQLKGGKRQFHLAEKSREQARFIASLGARMKKIAERKGPPAKGDDIMLSVINDGRHASIDMRLAGGDKESTPSKLDLMIDNAYEIWAGSKRQPFHKIGKDGKYEAKPATTGPATQLLFVNLGLSGARGFAVPDYIRAELTRRGVPKNEIAYIYDYKSATAKQRLFNDMNEGKVRILIGSVAKMGVGTNVQKRLLATHNMDPLWYPADDEQRVGRIIRQGNMNPEVQVHDYSTKGTYDSTMWGMMEKKARFIQGFFEGDPSLRDMEDLGEASQYEQAKALTTSDPRLIRFTELKQELERANRRKTAFDSDVYTTRQNRQKAKAQIEHYAQRIEDTKKDIKQRIDTRADAFSGKVGKETFDKRPDFGVALFERLKTLEDSGSLAGAVKVATVGGFDIYATVKKSNLIKDHTNTDVFMALNGNNTREVSYETSSLGTVRSIEHTLHGFESDLVEYEQRLAKAAKFFKDSESKAAAKFEGQADIDALAKQVADMAAELAKPIEEAPAPVEMTEEGDQELASLSDMTATLTPLADAQHAEVSELLTAIVRGMAGDIPSLEFNKGLIEVAPPPGYPAGMSNKAAGQYRLGQAIIRLALTSDVQQMMETAFHESFHHVEDRLLTAAELKLMREETPRLREWIKGKTGLSDAQVDGLAGFEVRAIAYQKYVSDRVANAKGAGNGIHIGVRRVFERLMEMLRKVMNGLRRLGFNTYKDVFNEVYTGKVAARKDRGQGGIDELADISSLADIYGAVNTRIRSKFGERFKELRVKFQDRFIRVRDVQDSFGGVPTAQDAYMAETLLPGRTGFRLEELEREHLEPLVAEMESRGIALEEISDHLYALHAPARNAAMDAINHPNLQGTGGRDLRGKGSGMSNDEAADILNRHSARQADFDAIVARVREIQSNTVETLIQYGLISQETADAWAASYPDGTYVPLQGFDEAFEDESMAGLRGAGLDTRARETKQAFGRLTKAAGPLPNIIVQSQLAIVRGEKNRVGNTMLRLVRAHPNPMWSINTPKLKKTIDRRTGLVTMVADVNWHNDPNVFVTKIGGNINVIRFEGKDGQNIARALKNMGVEDLGWALSFVRPLTVTMARLSTQWNPNFILPNFTRDLGEALINLQAQQQADFIKHFTKHLFPAIGGSFQAMRGNYTGRYAAAFREYDAAGGRVRFFGLDNAADVEKHFMRQLRALQGGPVATLQEMGKRIGDGLDLMSGPMENATRLAAYMAARDVGMSIPESANLAINLTVNFSKGGEYRAVMNSLYAFSNATMQGGRRNLNALKNKHVRRATYVLMGIGALSAVLGFAMGGDDESGESYYGKLPEWERDKNLILMFPKGFGMDGAYIKIPTPFLFGTMKVLGDRMAGLAMGKDKLGESVVSVFKSLISSLNPLGEESVSLFSLAPTVVRPPLHIATNKNWNGRPVYPDRDFEKNKPESEQSFETTPGYAKTAARGLNKIGGGSPYKSSGTLDVHPGSIQHTIESLTGGVGKFLTDVAGTADRLWKGEDFDATKAPILRRFVGTSNSEQSDRARYFEQREEARKNGMDPIRNARKDSARGINKEDADAFLKDNTNSPRGEQIFKNADAQMKPLRDRKERIEAKDSFSDEDRKAVQDIKQRMRDIQNGARKQYRELKQGAASP